MRDAAAEAARIAHLERRNWLDSHPSELDHIRTLDARIAQRTHHLGEQAGHTLPDHVVRLLGHPDTAPDPTAWQHAAGELEAYREQWQDPVDALDHPRFLHRAQARHWERVEHAVADAIEPPIRHDRGMDISL